MNASVAEGFAKELAAPTPGSAFFAAVDDDGTPLGLLSLRTDHDYFTKEPIAHISDIVVARAGEGRGVGRALLAFAEQWATDGDYRLMSLNVFAGNDRARRIYEEAGYEVEWTRMVKRV
ncbi:MAG: GNAT family N-acetyltransferase [Acidobacteria bacterium]|nr:GNAT family N-acetyltransferase [Acidobacteriota bacterium]